MAANTNDRIAELESALAFYRDAWTIEVKRGKGPASVGGGIVYKPNANLLDDCGEIAKSALSKQRGQTNGS